ncbi:hypothetical protein [Anaerorhabdus sp.]|uniref:hypothetical protein n=1 Tax=Anaerorhabdus sp. TaxID=1872524 RepID=UPI002FC88AD0
MKKLCIVLLILLCSCSNKETEQETIKYKVDQFPLPQIQVEENDSIEYGIVQGDELFLNVLHEENDNYTTKKLYSYNFVNDTLEEVQLDFDKESSRIISFNNDYYVRVFDLEQPMLSYEIVDRIDNELLFSGTTDDSIYSVPRINQFDTTLAMIVEKESMFYFLVEPSHQDKVELYNLDQPRYLNVYRYHDDIYMYESKENCINKITYIDNSLKEQKICSDHNEQIIPVMNKYLIVNKEGKYFYEDQEIDIQLPEIHDFCILDEGTLILSKGEVYFLTLENDQFIVTKLDGVTEGISFRGINGNSALVIGNDPIYKVSINN